MSDTNGKEAPSKPLAELVVYRRQEVRRKKIISNIAKLLFDDLTDLCFLQKFSVGFGIVRIGKPLLAERLGCSVPTITRAQQELTPGELWTRTGWYEGHEITIWFLRGVADGQLQFDQFTEGVMRRPKTKVAPRIPQVRNGHGKFAKADQVVQTPDLLENQKATAETTVHNGQNCRGATVSSAVATTAELPCASRQNHRAGHGRTDRSERSKLTVVNGQSDRNGHGKTNGSSPAGMPRYRKDLDNGMGDKAGTPPGRDDWERKLQKLWPRELDALKRDLLQQQKRVDPADSALVADISVRIEAIDRALYGGTAVTIRKKPGGPPAKVVTGPAKPGLSEEESALLMARMKLQDIPGSLTNANVLCLVNAGVELPEPVRSKFRHLVK